jgi:hypothetical protein
MAPRDQIDMVPALEPTIHGTKVKTTCIFTRFGEFKWRIVGDRQLFGI